MSQTSSTTPRLVRDLMSLGALSCAPDLPISRAAQMLLEANLEGMVVLDHDGHGVGCITWDELVKSYAHPGAQSLTVGEVMREDIPEIPPDIPLQAAAQLMQDRGQRIVFLMHNSAGIAYPAAIFTYRHILRHLAAESDEDIRDLGIKAEREAPLDQFIRNRDAAKRR
nr:CBS domain-containing protein [Anaerolineae bacterium]